MSDIDFLSIGELCKLVNGRAFKSSDWTDDGTPIVRIQNLNDPTKPFNRFRGEVEEKFLIDDGEILLAWSGTPGTSFGCFVWEGGPAILNQHIFRVIVNAEVVRPDFFVHVVNSKLDEMIALAHGGVGLRHITKGKLEAIQVPIPSLERQKEIAAHLKGAFECIREIGGLRSRGESEVTELLPAVIEDSMLDMPGKTVRLGDVCAIESRLVDPREDSHAHLLHVGGANIVGGTGTIFDVRTARDEGLKSGKFLFSEEDVLYNKIRPKLRKVARPDFSGLCSADMYPLRPDASEMSRDFLYFVLLSRDFTHYAVRVSNRAGMPKINRKGLFAYEFVLPSHEVQALLVKRLNRATETVLRFSTELLGAQSDLKRIGASVLRRVFGPLSAAN